MIGNLRRLKIGFLALAALVIFGFTLQPVLAQDKAVVLYVPLIGITSVPDSLALPKTGGKVTYNYAVKNFLSEAPLRDVKVVDDKCAPVAFIEGDDNNDALLDYGETWRFSCVTKLLATTQSVATVTGSANGLTATHKAYATVVVGSKIPPPIVSIINITKIAYPLSLPAEGGKITFTYKVNNPGIVPLSNVVVADDKCSAMSGKLGDTNGNNLLDVTEVWIYRCTTTLTQTTTNTVHVSAFANGLKAVSDATVTVEVDAPAVIPSSSIFSKIIAHLTISTILGGFFLVALIVLITLFVLTKNSKSRKMKKKSRYIFYAILILITGAVVVLSIFYLLPTKNQKIATNIVSDSLFGWKFPVTDFPSLGQNDLAYSDIRDPGGVPQGLPVRLKIPIIGVDSAIEDALITPDGKMDVPSGSEDVAWFSLGPHPGQEGSAVIGGHFGIENGNPFVFYDLDKLKVGDKVYVEDDKDATLAFVVRSISLFDREADATTVFTSKDGIAHLNLITCEGVWNQVNGTYSERRVVFTDAIPSEGPITVQPVSLSSAPITEATKESPFPTATLPVVIIIVLISGITFMSFKIIRR